MIESVPDEFDYNMENFVFATTSDDDSPCVDSGNRMSLVQLAKYP